MPSFIKKIQNFAHYNDLWQKNAKILIGVSGGADSVCLFHVLLYLSKKYNFSLHIAHINYNLRGKDSDADEKLVKALAHDNNIEISVLQEKKPQKKANLENSLREIRYDFFEKIRKKIDFDYIAIAHNQDDQAETVLFRLFRGSGLEGISSIRAKNGKIIRPLLSTSRKEILNYLKENNLKFNIDSSNLKPIFMRNKIRLNLIPYLEKEFNPNIKESLSLFAQNTTDEFNYINDIARRKCSFIKISKKVAVFNCEEALKLHPAIMRQCLRLTLKKLRGNLFNIESTHIKEIEKILRSSKNKHHESSFKGLKITKKGATINLFCLK